MVLDGCIQLDASLNWPSAWIRGFLAPATCSPHSCGSPHDAAPWRRPGHCRNAPKMATEEVLEKIGDLWLLAMENGWKYMENRRKWMKTYGKWWKCYGKWMKIYRNRRNWMKKKWKLPIDPFISIKIWYDGHLFPRWSMLMNHLPWG